MQGCESSGEVSFPEMFWDSLKPFPGRGRITLRLAVACTLIVLVADTFRMPFQDLLPFFVLFVTKEEKVTTTVTALLVLFAVTLAIAAAILIYKSTGDRAEFRIPGIALEIFIGMYLFRVLSIAAVGWILGFVVAAAQSLVYLFPNPEETVHQFLWLWVAIAFSTAVAWLANLLLFPVSPIQLLQREFVARWHAVSAATEQLAASQPSAEGRHFDQEIIVLCVRWYLTFKLSSRDLVQMMADRGITVTHTTILRWVQRYVPEFEKRWSRYARPVGDSWRVDETYLKISGQWVYLYRAVDKAGSNRRLPPEQTA